MTADKPYQLERPTATELGDRLVRANQIRSGNFPLTTREKCFAALDRLAIESEALRLLNDGEIRTTQAFVLAVKQYIWKLEGA